MRFGTLPGGRTLFLDLDGVMADFDGGFVQRFGVDNRSLDDDYMWELINSCGDRFFAELPACLGAFCAFSILSRFHPIVLTACPASNYASVAAQKREWVRHHFGPNVPVLPTCGGKTKPLFMHAPGDILIDDFERNVERWEQAGGVGILHDGDFNSTLKRLEEVLWPKTLAASGTNLAQNAAPKTTSPGTTTDTRTASPQGAATVNLPEEKPFWLTPADPCVVPQS